MNLVILIISCLILFAIFALFLFQRFLLNWRLNLILSKLRDGGWHPSSHVLVDQAWIPLLERLIDKGHVAQRMEGQGAVYQITDRGLKRIEKIYKRVEKNRIDMGA